MGATHTHTHTHTHTYMQVKDLRTGRYESS